VTPSPIRFFVVKGSPRGVKVRPLHGLNIAGFRVFIKTPELNKILAKAICREIPKLLKPPQALSPT